MSIIKPDDIEVTIKSKDNTIFKKKVDNMIASIDNAYINVGEYNVDALMNTLCRIVENTTLISTVQALFEMVNEDAFKNIIDKVQNGEVNLKARNIKSMMNDVQKKLFLSSFQNALTEMVNAVTEKVSKELDIKDENNDEYTYTIKIYEEDKLYKTLYGNNVALCSPDAGSAFISNIKDEDERASTAHSIATNMLSYLAMYIICTLTEDNVYNFSERLATDSKTYEAFNLTLKDIFESVKDYHKSEYLQNKMKEVGPGQMIIDKEAYVDAMLKEQRDRLLAELDELQNLQNDSE